MKTGEEKHYSLLRFEAKACEWKAGHGNNNNSSSSIIWRQIWRWEYFPGFLLSLILYSLFCDHVFLCSVFDY